MRSVILFFLVTFLFGCTTTEDPLMVSVQVTTFFNTNSYLLYTENTAEAALIDVGGAIPELMDIINEKNLVVKYFLVTHAHPDHIAGIIMVRDRFPEAILVMSSEEFEDMKSVYAHWETRLSESLIEQIRGNEAVLYLFNMDYDALGKPGIVVRDQDQIKLGKHIITAYHTPGHARGSICYFAAPFLFSGDELYYRNVGQTNTPLTSSWDDQVRSIRRLYAVLPDSTIVYPGHGQPTSIGSEKKENPHISEDEAHQRSDPTP